MTGKNFSIILGLVFGLDLILNRTFRLNFMSKNIVNHFLIKNKILNLKNLYLYHCANETFKILKFRSPIVVHNLYKFSTRGQRNLFIITPPPYNTFIYKSSVIWNSVKSIFKIDDLATSVSILKLKLKTYFLNKQLLGDAENWVENNFIQ